MNRQVECNSKNHLLYMEVGDILQGGTVVEDVQAITAFTKFANEIIAEFGSICNQPFCLQLREFSCDDCGTYVEVMSIDDEGNEVFLREEGSNTKVVMDQSYVATNLQSLQESYAGKYEVVAFMTCPEVSDGDAMAVENPMAQILAKLACTCYCTVIAEDYPEWITQYINAPTVKCSVVPAKP